MSEQLTATVIVPDAPPSPLAAIRVDGLRKSFGTGSRQVEAIGGIDLSVRRGEFLSVLGASGCGKSTLLNLIAGLDAPSAGTITTTGPAALMFQESALFGWLTVRKNVELPLRLRGVPRAERRERAAALLDQVRLSGFADRRPHELSGGMRQRAALARAFAQDSEILLMDEPFGALDAMTRDLLHAELEQLWADRNQTIVFVTHNVREAVRLGDRVVLLTSRPGTVAEEFAVDIERPRRIESPEVSSLAGTITERLKQEVRRHAG